MLLRAGAGRAALLGLALAASLTACQRTGPGAGAPPAGAVFDLAGSGPLALLLPRDSVRFERYWREVEGQDGLLLAASDGSLAAETLCPAGCSREQALDLLAGCAELVAPRGERCALLARGRAVLWQGEVLDPHGHHPALVAHNLRMAQVLAIEAPGEAEILLSRLVVDPRAPHGAFRAASPQNYATTGVCLGSYDLTDEMGVRGWNVSCPRTGFSARGTFASFAPLIGGPGAGIDREGNLVRANLSARGALLGTGVQGSPALTEAIGHLPGVATGGLE
jgi:hypothetical protein